MDATGEGILIYSEDREQVNAQTFDKEFVRVIVDTFDMIPLSKRYAMAEIAPDGKIVIGDELPPQSF